MSISMKKELTEIS